MRKPTSNSDATSDSPSLLGASARPRPRLVNFVNGIFAEQIGGGDIHFAYMMKAAIGAGYPVHFFGGHALLRYLERQGFPRNITLTDGGMARLGDTARLPGQLHLLFDFFRRLFGSLRKLREVKREDIAYSMSDYWFDTIPLMLCRSRAKVLYLAMMAPTFGQVIWKTRADVTASRLASLYYWLSQQFSLRVFRWCRNRIVTYSHPDMRAYLLRLGYEGSDLVYVPNGSDVEAADRVPPQSKDYDLVWMGRVHPQKGIDDLLAVLAWLKQRIPDYRAVIIGNSQKALEPRVHELGVESHVTFAGLVSEAEKFRLLKSSRVFVMPSRYESWGIVIGEALAVGVPVVAYELACYRPVFGEFVRYVAPFNQAAFRDAVEEEIRRQRAGKNYLASLDLEGLKCGFSWTAAQKHFREMLDRMAVGCASECSPAG